ncbi:MAG: polyphosphate polymerase domain-containing protein [Oscillospiraceae bacterium]|nr:polyphosphate polymerase domain-containing protein [Oscillospiraceae bacterium]
MAIEVFNRYENKYLIGEKTFARIRERLSGYMELDAYNRQHETYQIANLYYDTEDNHLIRTSLAKPAYREKVRLRAYGTPDGDSVVYAEIKKKVRGLVNKRRTAMKLSAAYGFLESGEPPEPEPGMNRQVAAELEYILATRKLVPAAYISYDRLAYFGEGDLRVSFDANIRSRRTDLRLESGAYGGELLGTGERLLEIKTSRAFPLWLCGLLSENKVYPASFSKYGAEYKSLLRGKAAADAPYAKTAVGL